MRTFVAIATATLALGLVSRPTSALQGSESAPPLNSIQMIDAKTGWAKTLCMTCPEGARVGLWRTTDGGRTWEDVRPKDPTGRRIDAGLLYANSNVAWVNSANGMWRSTNGGRTWKNIPIPTIQGLQEKVGFMAISFPNAREGWGLVPLGGYAGGREVVVYRTTDGGDTWTNAATHINTASHLQGTFGVVGGPDSIVFFNSAIGIITAKGDPGHETPRITVTRDGGRTWADEFLPPRPQLKPPVLPDDPVACQPSVHPAKIFTPQDAVMHVDFTCYRTVSGESTQPFALLYVTHDSGTTWKYTTPLPLESSDEYGQVKTSSDFIDFNRGWLGDSTAQTLYTTTDGGQTWRILRSGNFPATKQLNFISPQVGWAVTDSAPFLLKTPDGGRTWTPVTYTIRVSEGN